MCNRARCRGIDLQYGNPLSVCQPFVFDGRDRREVQTKSKRVDVDTVLFDNCTDNPQGIISAVRSRDRTPSIHDSLSVAIHLEEESEGARQVQFVAGVRSSGISEREREFIVDIVRRIDDRQLGAVDSRAEAGLLILRAAVVEEIEDIADIHRSKVKRLAPGCLISAVRIERKVAEHDGKHRSGRIDT